MKKVMRSLLVLSLAAFVLTSCNKNTPKDVAYNWLIAFNHFDFDAAKKISTSDTKSLLSSLQEMTEKITDSNKKDRQKVSVTIKDVKENGDKAVVTYTTSDEPNKDLTLNLIKLDSKWLVQFSKIDLMGVAPGPDDDVPTDADSTGGGTGAPQDTTMSTDSASHAQ